MKILTVNTQILNFIVFFEIVNKSTKLILEFIRHFTIITQETPDMNKENFMKSTTAWKDLLWSVGGRWVVGRWSVSGRRVGGRPTTYAPCSILPTCRYICLRHHTVEKNPFWKARSPQRFSQVQRSKSIIIRERNYSSHGVMFRLSYVNIWRYTNCKLL